MIVARMRVLRMLRALAISALALGGIACGRGDRAAVTVGEPAPAYSTHTLDGTPIALADLRGNVVLLNIWATWCKPCREEIPALEQLHQRHRDAGLVIAGVSIDQPGDQEKVATFARDLGATYTLWHDPDDVVSTTFLAIGVPASYLIGRDGTLLWKHVGPVTADDSVLNAALTAALNE